MDERERPLPPDWVFTDRARRVLHAAEEAAAKEGSPVETRHLLGALVSDPGSMAWQVLRRIGVEPKALLERLGEEGSPEGEPPEATPATYGRHAFVALERARAEGRRMDREHSGTEDILLGLLGERESDACRLLTSEGASLTAAREATDDLLRPLLTRSR